MAAEEGVEWLHRLTTADGLAIIFDPLLLEDDKDDLSSVNDASDSVDDHSEEDDDDPYAELGSTPPRQILARNRKWSADKKHSRQMENSLPTFWSYPCPARNWSYGGVKVVNTRLFPRGGSFAQRSHLSLSRKFAFSRDLIGSQEQNYYDSDTDDMHSEKSSMTPGQNVEGEDDEKCESNSATLGPSLFGWSSPVSIRQADSLPMGYRVETTNRFLSLASRPVTSTSKPPQGSQPNSGNTTPKKRCSLGGQDRQAFFRVLTALYTSQKKQEKETNSDKSELSDAYERQQSKEDTLWQNEIKEVIWLELQAWFAGNTVNIQDQWILHQRKLVDQVFYMVGNYQFVPNNETQEQDIFNQLSMESSNSHGQDVFYDAQEIVERKVRSVCLEDDAQNSGEVRRVEMISKEYELSINKDNSNAETNTRDQMINAHKDEVEVSPMRSTEHNQNDFCDSLEVFCQERTKTTSKALKEVEDILTGIADCESLFPSTRHLVTANIAWGEEQFQTRVKVLCMWYNITRQLQQRVDQLGDMLCGIAWPKLSIRNEENNEDEGPTNVETSTQNVADDKSPVPTVEVPYKKMLGSPQKLSYIFLFKIEKHIFSQVVTFHVIEDIAPGSSPSDSNNSADSAPKASPTIDLSTAKRQDSSMSAGSVNSSVLSESESFDSTSPYRKYVEKHLKAKGIRKTLSTLNRITRGPLHRARVVLEKSDSEDLTSTEGDLPSHLEERFSSFTNLSEDDKELVHYGCWSQQFMAMKLPSFRAVYLFLCSVPKDIILECLKIRLEQKPVEPSELSIRQLMRECKEALRLAVSERQKYISRVRAAVYDLDKDKQFLVNFEQEMEDFDDCLTRTLDVYSEYLRSFVMMIQGDTSLLISTYQKNLLEQEWDFIKTICPHIPGGEARASNTFCQMACGMLISIGDFLRMGSDEIIKNMYDVSDDTDLEENITRKILFEAFRGFQTLFGEARERALKAIAFGKLLRKDLEVSAEFGVTTSPGELLERLNTKGYVQVIVPHSAQHMIFAPKDISGHQDSILHLLNIHCGDASGFISTNKGHLVLVSHSLCSDAVAKWEGETIHVKPTAETVIALAQIMVSEVLIIAPSAGSLDACRKEFLKNMKDVLSITTEQRAISQAIANSLDQVKEEALQLRSQICEELAMVEESCDLSPLNQYDKEALSRRMREILHLFYKFGFEYHRELDRMMTGEWARRELAQGVVQFSMQWIRFVLKWCERGRGLKPDWATKGIEFLYFAANPTITKFLTDEEFENFKTVTEDCHSHVVGQREAPDRRHSLSPSPYERDRPRIFSRPNSRPGSPTWSGHDDMLPSNTKKMSLPDALAMSASPAWSMARRRSQTYKEEDDQAEKAPVLASLPWKERVKLSIEKLEDGMEETRRDLLIIGQVLDKTQPEGRIHIKARLVRFSWQRGVKIGQGNFGKVYTAINNDTGDIMAMKEIPLQPNDHKTLRSVADELRIFESIHHRHLVKHFGVEIHREEMLIFMEYCPEGTIEALIMSIEEGLDEVIVRRYTKQMVEAVACLHEHGVVHRDIKGANIFLTQEMKTIKLGDFGCSVKIKSHTTMPGELQGFVGTQAYMAPEVFTRNMKEGHGRASDIWSVGCVVLEMVQGKRPWADLKSNYQIMFKVGMGQSPEVPDHLSQEGKDFLGTCFVHLPEERATAQDLLSHNFTKIFEEDENPSLPLFASISDFSETKRSLVRKSSGKY